MTLDELLRGLRACIVNGDDEDAQENIFDLLRGLRCKDTPDVELTKVGLGLKELWKREQPTVAIQDESMGTAPIDEAQAAGRAVRQGLHTPGPWEVKGPSQNGHCRRIFAGDEYIAIAGGSDQPMRTIRANADLIAAAPELLEACQKMITAFEYSGSNLVGAEYMAKESIKAAIEKATGE
jgi:hypothetical protein